MSKKHRIGVIGGDGIGPEVIAEGLKVAKSAGVDFDITEYDLGGGRYLKDGTILPDEVIAEWRGLDALYLGAVGTPEVPPGVIERGLLLKMRFELDLYINLRPFVREPQATPQLVSKPASQPDGVNGDGPSGKPAFDFEVIRENTEGSYVGEGGFLRKGTSAEVATQGSVNTRKGVERCIRFAFERAQSRSRKHLTLVHKTNVLTFAGDLWERTFNEVAGEYPDVETAYNHVDAACIYFVESPERYDVIVTDNLFGDILTDLGGAIAGGIGRAASANLNPDRTGPSMFEPVHGSAPDIAGKGLADPSAAILSLAMMLDFLGETKAAGKIEAACRELIQSEDIEANTGGGAAQVTSQIGDRVADLVAG